MGYLLGFLIGLGIVWVIWRVSEENFHKELNYLMTHSDSEHVMCLSCVETYYSDTGLAEGNIATQPGFMTLRAMRDQKCGFCRRPIMKGESRVPFHVPAWEEWTDWPEKQAMRMKNLGF